ncbi:hypothetical protein EG831_03105, partial [bacterium]|nr:hypothetical protein [bacterium]
MPFRFFLPLSRLRAPVSRRGRAVLALLVFVALFPVLPRLWPKAPLATWAPSSVAVYDSQHRLLRLTLAGDEQYRLWVPLEKISPALVEGVMLY